MRVPLPPGLEKPPVMDIYDGSTDHDDHIENIEAMLDWRRVRGAIKSMHIAPPNMHIVSMALCMVGNGLIKTISHCHRTKQVSNSESRLLH
jgi:hypothetical protein